MMQSAKPAPAKPEPPKAEQTKAEQSKTEQAKAETRKLARATQPGGIAQAAASQVEVDHPRPPESNFENWQSFGYVAMMMVGGVVFIAALYHARSILMPVLAAMMIGLAFSPLQKKAAAYKIPGIVTSLLLMTLILGGIYGLFVLIIGPFTDGLAKAPEFAATIKQKMMWLDRPLAVFRDLSKSLGETTGGSSPKVAVETSLPTILQQTVSILTPAVTELLVFVGTLLFFLVGYTKLRRQAITAFETRDARLRVVRIWNDIEQNLVTYLSTVTVINLCLGLVTTALLFVLGFPSPAAFGVLAFILNYIPYIGPGLVVLALFLVGVVTLPTLGSALLPPLLFVTITTIEGHFITPSIVGRRLTLSPFLVFLALAFWTWLWGPLGAFMAVPLLIVSLVMLSHLFPTDTQQPLPG